MDTKEFLPNWEQSTFPQFKILHFQAAKLQKAILSQDENKVGRKELALEFYDWFNHLDEQFCALLDGGIIDAHAEKFDALALIFKIEADLSGNQAIYQTLRKKFNALLDSQV